jgi:hypothetical protein
VSVRVFGLDAAETGSTAPQTEQDGIGGWENGGKKKLPSYKLRLSDKKLPQPYFGRRRKFHEQPACQHGRPDLRSQDMTRDPCIGAQANGPRRAKSNNMDLQQAANGTQVCGKI